MARTILNEEEMTFLATIEPKLKTAVEARWISHLPQSAIDRMLEIWEALSGTKRAFRNGCGTCILNLAVDLGTLYFAKKEDEKRIAAELAAKKKAEEAARKKAEEAAKKKAEAEARKKAEAEARKKAEAESQGGSSEKPNTQAAEKQEKAQNAPKGAKGNKTTAGGKKSASGKNNK